jgi:hypothetical protein
MPRQLPKDAMESPRDSLLNGIQDTHVFFSLIYLKGTSKWANKLLWIPLVDSRLGMKCPIIYLFYKKGLSGL